MRPPWLRVSAGFGDLIALSGAAIDQANQYGEIEIPCAAKYLASAEDLFRNHPNIKIIELDVSPGKRWRVDEINKPGVNLVVGIEEIDPRDCKTDCYQYLYEKLGIEYAKRWELCPLAEAVKGVEQAMADATGFAFVHHHVSRGFKIDPRRIPEADLRLPVVIPEDIPGSSILRFGSLIINAEAGHCIDSVMFWMAEHLPRKGRWTLHRYAKRPHLAVWTDFLTRQLWRIEE